MPSNASNGKVLRRANPSTIQDKFMVGYQGWFTCAGDGKPIGPGHHGWLHWFNYPIPDGGRPNTDLWPDVSEYSSSELYSAPGLKLTSGEQATLFSSRHPRTVRRHFNWMAQHGVDGAFLQRFAGQCDLEGGNKGIRDQRDEIGDRVKEAAEAEGRVFAIMYDVSGVAPDRIQRVLEQDWIHLIRDKGVLNSPNYLKEKGKPVISLWGFGFENSNHNPATIRAITAFFRKYTPGGAFIIAGTPAHWRTSRSDADPNPEFLDIWLNEFDALSPWTVGRYGNEDEADDFAEDKIKPDIELLKKRAEEGHKKVDYMPVVLPGGSGFNLSEGKWGFNGIKRNGGKFLWKQIHNARRLGVRVMYGAMWDEYDEGTAFMPVVQTKRQVPVSKFHFMALDEDGFDLPSDWYMRICGFAAEGLRSERMIHETFPSKELQDYWSTRPHYEDQVEGPASGSSSGGAATNGDEEQKYQAWLKTQKEDTDEPPPPAYSLEAGEPEAPAATQPPSSVLAPPERTSSPTPIELVGTTQSGNPNVFSVAAQSVAVATSSGPPPVPPAGPASTNNFPQPGSSVHSVSIDSLADNFLRQSSLSPPVHPQLQQQPYSTTGSVSPPVPVGSASPHSLGPLPSVQSPSSSQGSAYGSGPDSHPAAGSYFPSSPQPQPQPHAQYSYGSALGGQIPPQQPQLQHQYSYGTPQGVPQHPQPHHYSSGPPPGPQAPAQWPPADWNTSSQSPQPPHLPYPPQPQPQPSYQNSGGFAPAPSSQAPPFNTDQYSSPLPGPSSPAASFPPNQYGGAPPNRPPGGYPIPPQHHPQQQPYHNHTLPIASNALNMAFSAVGSFAGDHRRRQFEESVDKLTQSGAKLYHKFK